MPQWEEFYWVSPHAVRRYQERVDKRARWQEAIDAINRGIQGVAPQYPPEGRPIALGDRGRKFVAIVAPPSPPEQPSPQVMTIWGWGMCPILLKRKDTVRGRRRYRWLNGPYPGRAP